MSLDSILGIIIIPVVFIWIGAKIYNHEKEHIDPIIKTVKGWFTKKEELPDESSNEGMDYSINYRGAEY